MRLLTTVLLSLTALAASAATASAATLTRTDDTIEYAGEGTEVNRVTVTANATDYVFTEQPGVTITASGDCTGTAPPSNVATCPIEGTARIDLVTGEGADEVTLTEINEIVVTESGGAGEDTLRGTTGYGANVTLIGGAGRDTYETLPDRATYVSYRDRGDDLAISLDGVANDPDGENVGPEVYGVEGGEGDDAITGSPGHDYLGGLGGHDVIVGLAGRDGMFGGAGDDRLDGGDDIDQGFGEDGTDDVRGGPGDDENLSGGPGDDALDGGSGTDALTADPGSDSIRGGEGFDRYFSRVTEYAGPAARDVTLSLDDVANDGQAGERDNVHTDIEDLSASAGASSTPGRVTVTGDASFNAIATHDAADTVDPGAGADQVSTFAGDDQVAARDGFGDRIDCGRGADTAVVDHLDLVTDCETVDRSAAPPVPPGPAGPPSADDAPPTARFVTPLAGALLRTDAPSAITVDASDDRAISRVVLIDDGRVVAADDSAPYTFAYRPTGDDVGRNTLVAMALDSSEQSGSAVLPVRVDRFRPAVTARTTPARARRAPYRFRTTGTVTPPAGVTPAAGCSEGFMAVQVKRGTRTISTRRVRIKRGCTFSSTVTFRDRRRLGAGRLRVRARWLGNDVLAPRSAPAMSVRATPSRRTR